MIDEDQHEREDGAQDEVHYGSTRSVAVDAGQRAVLVVEFEAVGRLPVLVGSTSNCSQTRRTVAGCERAVAEHEPPVAAGLALGGGLDRVDLHALDPAVVEHQPRMLDRRERADVDPGLEEDAAAHGLGR